MILYVPTYSYTYIPIPTPTITSLERYKYYIFKKYFFFNEKRRYLPTWQVSEHLPIVPTYLFLDYILTSSHENKAYLHFGTWKCYSVPIIYS